MFPAAHLRLYPLYAPLNVYSILSPPAQVSGLLGRIPSVIPLRDYTFPVDWIECPPGA